MALTLDTNTDASYGLSEYIHFIEANVDLDDADSIVESAPALRKLANNRQFIAEHLNEQLASWSTFQSYNRYSSQTLLLGRGEGFYVRANIWEPPDPAMDLAAQDQLFAYEIPHDHNFTFMTAGYLGPGYETVIYEYEREKTIGVPGEKANLAFLERTTLPEGKIMLYRACKDVHIQKHAPAFSISLNLMIHPPDLHDKDRYFFDIEGDKIGDHVPTQGTGRVMLCRLAAHIGDSRSSSLLDELGSKHGSRRVRAEALQSLSILEPSSQSYVARKAAMDPDPYVRLVADYQRAGER